jgi:hypothetical protein
MNNKKIDAVKMMREIRDKLSKKYKDDPQAEEKDLERIRKKYKIRATKQQRSSANVA